MRVNVILHMLLLMRALKVFAPGVTLISMCISTSLTRLFVIRMMLTLMLLVIKKPPNCWNFCRIDDNFDPKMATAEILKKNEQRTDKSLAHCWSLAEGDKAGYFVKNGILYRHQNLTALIMNSSCYLLTVELRS